MSYEYKERVLGRVREAIQKETEKTDIPVIVGTSPGHLLFENNAVLGVAAFQIPTRRGMNAEHKYVMLMLESERVIELFVGGPVKAFPFHKNIVAAVEAAFPKANVRVCGGGHYRVNPLKVYGNSEAYGKTRYYSDDALTLLLGNPFHGLDKALGDSSIDVKTTGEMFRRLQEMPEEDRNNEIIRRLHPWLEFMAHKTDVVPPDPKDTAFPLLSLAFGKGDHDTFYNLLNMGWDLYLSTPNEDSCYMPTYAKFTGTLPESTKILLEEVAKHDFEGMAEKGGPVHIAVVVRGLHDMGLLTAAVEQCAVDALPKSFAKWGEHAKWSANEFRQQENISFNFRTFLKALSKTTVYASGVDAIREFVDGVKAARGLSPKEEKWYSDCLEACKRYGEKPSKDGEFQSAPRFEKRPVPAKPGTRENGGKLQRKQ